MHKQLITFAFAALAVSSSSQAAFAQSWPIAPMIVEGDNVVGVGNVTSIGRMAIGNDGNWRIVVDTDNPITDEDNAYVGKTGVIFQEGKSLPLPVGALLDTFDSVTIDNEGNSLNNYFLDGTTGFNDDSGIYFNDSLLIQEGDLSGAPEFGIGTVYRGFFETKLTSFSQAVLLVSVDDPLIPSTVDQAIVRLFLGLSGNLISESVLAKEGDLIGGGAITTFGTNEKSFAMSSSGNLIYYADTDLPAGSDGMIVLNGVPIATEGGPSPIAGELWNSLSTTAVDVNNDGDYAYTGRLQGSTATDTVLVRNGAVLIREGDALPGLPGTMLTTFGSAPVKLAEDGSVLWMATYNTSSTTGDKALFVNDQMIAQEGVTTSAGIVISDLKSLGGAMDFSENGLYVIFEADLVGGVNAALIAIKSAASAMFLGGCGPVTGLMLVTAGSPAIGTTMDLRFLQAQSNAALTYILVSATPDPDPMGCGTTVPGIGIALIGLAPTPELIPVGLFTGADLLVPVNIPNDPSFVGVTLYTQGLFASPSTPAELFRLTNGQTLTFGL